MFALLFAVLGFVACSDDGSSSGEEIIRRIDDEGMIFSPTVIDGSVEYLPSMKPSKLRIVKLKNDLSPIDSFEVEVKWHNGYEFEFVSRDYESPYVKIVTVFSAQDDQKMEMTQYINLLDKKKNWKLNLYAALAADRIKALMEKKNLDFEKAQKTAFEELGKIFDESLEDLQERDFSGFDYNNHLLDFKPYIYCRHEVSDSVFYADFKKLRETFAEKGALDSSWIINAADTWLSTFEIFSDEAQYLFRSVSRDSADFLYWLDERFFSRAYGILLDEDSSTTVVNKNKASAFYGRTFVYTDCVKSGIWQKKWRLLSDLEDSLGICEYEMNYKPTKYIQGSDTLYACRPDSHIWEVITERDSLINHQYGECSWYQNRGQPVYVHDSLFVCECESSENCFWSDKYVKRVFLQIDTMYAKVLDAKATARFGRCMYENSGKMQKLDSLYVECSSNKWNSIDSLQYYLGHCSSDNYKGKHNGAYYSCQGKYPDINDTTWHEIYPPEYYNEECELNRIVKYDSSYYICERLECEGDGCFAFRNWRKLKDAELIPPVLNMDTCESPQQNMKIVYDDEFYECKNGKWETVPKESLSPPEKEGLVCNDSLFGEIKRSGNDYFRCDSDFFWKKLIQKDALPLLYRDSLGECDTIANKILHWNEDKYAFVGCMAAEDAENTYEWAKVSFGSNTYDLPASLERKKFAGNDVSGSVYDVTVDGVNYHFDIIKYSYTLHMLILTRMDYGGKSYAAYAYNGNLFLHSETGKDSVLLNSIENKSDSYDVFYADWKKQIAKDCKCNMDLNLVVHDDSVSVIAYDENTFVTYEEAKAFCPKGFHIPDTTEFMKKFGFATTLREFRNDSPIIWIYGTEFAYGCSGFNTIHADLFWTGTEKDSDTQYCYETSMRAVTMDIKVQRIVECPKDLYPMVQVMCVQDE